MPTYNFKNTETGECWEELMTMSGKETFLEENPHIIQTPPTKMNIVSGVSITNNVDPGWSETLSRIASANPGSSLDNDHRTKSISEVKKQAAVEKWRKSNNKT